jgi:membrane protein implicated in regulation of membrane protease activity
VRGVRNRPPLWYTIQAIVGTFIEELALVVIVLWALPYFGVRAPLWVLGLLMLALAMLAYVRYRLGRTTFFLPHKGYVESLVGCEGVVTSPLTPEGYVKIQGVLWKASCIEDYLDEGTEVMVLEVDGLKLLVTPKNQV